MDTIYQYQLFPVSPLSLSIIRNTEKEYKFFPQFII